MTIKDVRIGSPAIEALSDPLADDLLAWYKQAQESVMDLIAQAGDEGWTADELLAKIDALFDDDSKAGTVAKSMLVEKARPLMNRYEFQGLPISVENAAGSTRSGVDQDGTPWETRMINDYGYIRGTTGADGDAVDCFIGPNRGARTVYIIHIKNPETGEYDEDKCFLGFLNAADARNIFDRHYDNPDQFYYGMTSMDIDDFGVWLETQTRAKVAKGDIMPVPAAGEAEEAFISRCTRQVMGEGKTQDQALGECYGIWKQHHTDKSVRKAMPLKIMTYDGAMDAGELKAGTTHEMNEHGIDVNSAVKMASDHLARDPQYYTKLKGAGLA